MLLCDVRRVVRVGRRTNSRDKSGVLLDEGGREVVDCMGGRMTVQEVLAVEQANVKYECSRAGSAKAIWQSKV